MPTVAENIEAVETIERETLDTSPIVTTLYDLVTALNEQVEPREEDVVIAAVADTIARHLDELSSLDRAGSVADRHKRFRDIGEFEQAAANNGAGDS